MRGSLLVLLTSLPPPISILVARLHLTQYRRKLKPSTEHLSPPFLRTHFRDLPPFCQQCKKENVLPGQISFSPAPLAYPSQSLTRAAL